MTPAMDPCPYARRKDRGRHCLSVLVPESADYPAVLFCDRCGATKNVRVDYPMAPDDMTSEALALLTRTTNG